MAFDLYLQVDPEEAMAYMEKLEQAKRLKQETDEEDGNGAEDDGEIFVDAAIAQRNPSDDEEPANHTDGSIDVASLAREESQ